jgi:hypothetical protein
MAKINKANGRQVIDYMVRDYESFKQAILDNWEKMANAIASGIVGYIKDHLTIRIKGNTKPVDTDQHQHGVDLPLEISVDPAQNNKHTE